MVMYIAGTRKNYGRRFWRCPRWQVSLVDSEFNFVIYCVNFDFV
jgi:hypothetical protein